MAVTLISILIFCACLGAILAVYGIPASVSETFCLLPKGRRWLSLACLLAAGMACFCLWRRASRKAGKPQFANIVFWAEAWAFVSLFASILICTMDQARGGRNLPGVIQRGHHGWQSLHDGGQRRV